MPEFDARRILGCAPGKLRNGEENGRCQARAEEIDRLLNQHN
jgi:hypothetical protein